MTTVNVHEAKTHLSRLLEAAAAGEEIIIAKAGKPIAKLVPIEKPKREPGRLKGLIQWSDAFFDPLPDDVLEVMENGYEMIRCARSEPLTGHPRADLVAGESPHAFRSCPRCGRRPGKRGLRQQR
ncbi:MAG: type II toxin-antitoxin system Phd/YefM family antitoxin [Beggiatoa sp.]|nr:type II toxin-antitoxin system Phd/YefM family antitoxin [Beggiatoa sp.]